MPGTDQDCSCEIRAVQSGMIAMNITAVTVYLYGSDADPCRERLTIHAGRSYPICPEQQQSGYSYVSNGHALFPRLVIEEMSTLAIQLKTNRTTATEPRGKVLLSIASYGKYESKSKPLQAKQSTGRV